MPSFSGRISITVSLSPRLRNAEGISSVFGDNFAETIWVWRAFLRQLWNFDSNCFGFKTFLFYEIRVVVSIFQLSAEFRHSGGLFKCSSLARCYICDCDAVIKSMCIMMWIIIFKFQFSCLKNSAFCRLQIRADLDLRTPIFDLKIAYNSSIPK